MKITLTLEHYDLDNMAITDIEPNLEKEGNAKRSKQACTIIMLGLDDDMQAAMAKHKMAYQLFKALQQTYEQKS